MQGFQMYCKARFVNFNGEKTLINPKIYLNKDNITEEKVEEFKNSCADGGGIYDMNRDTMIITVIEVEIIE